MLPRAKDAAYNSRIWEHMAFCLDGTRVDLLKAILVWSKDADLPTIYWLNGMAGTGKSTISRTIARQCAYEGRLGASFCFSKHQAELSNANKLFTTIASQLAQNVSALRALICSAAAKDPNIQEKGLSEQWKHLIFQPASDLNKQNTQPQLYVIVIDALDECEAEDDISLIIRLLSQTATLTHMRLKIFITSRPETPIRSGFRALPVYNHQDLYLHDISRDIVENDIFLYLESEFAGIRNDLVISSDWPGNETIRRIAQKANGLFIYAATVCRFLRKSRFHPRPRLGLILNDETHPSSTGVLDKIYSDILMNSIIGGCEEPDKTELSEQFKRTVGSIVVLSESLDAMSINELLGQDQGETNALLNCLHSVLELTGNSGSSNIRLLHPSFRDFLLDSQRCKDTLFYVHEQKAHRTVFINCLRLMQKLRNDICGLQHPGAAASEADERKVKNALPRSLQYACRYWIHHLQQSDIILRDNDDVYSFLREHFLHWVEALSLMGMMSECINAIITLDSKVQTRRKLVSLSVNTDVV